MATGRLRGQSGGGPGKLQWTALGGATLVIVVLTFALGMLVGRQWARHTPTPATAEAPHKATSSPRRSGLAEPSADRTVARQEKLTFYQTLTAPIGAVPLSDKSEVSSKPDTASKPRPKPETTLAREPESSPVRGDGSNAPSRAAASNLKARSADRPQEGSAEWAVQVGVFKNAEQAERIRRQLAEGGFAVRLTSVPADDGQLRFRVRVGAFKTRDEALKMAERIRADRALPTYVTAN